MTSQAIQYLKIPEQLDCDGSVFPMIVVNDGSLQTQAQCATWIKANLPELETQLHQSGAVLFRGFPINSAETFDEFSNAFAYPNFTYKESLSNAVRINFTERVFTANEAPRMWKSFCIMKWHKPPYHRASCFSSVKVPLNKGAPLLYAALICYLPNLPGICLSSPRSL
jgi:hypothetical protein